MLPNLPIVYAVPLSDITGEDAEDTELLNAMAGEASRYVRSFGWCREVLDAYFGDGIGGVIGLFLFYVKIKNFVEPEWIWVFIGDVPSAYMLVGSCRTPHQALAGYIDGLEEWLRFAASGDLSSDLIPIEVPPTDENKSMIASRVVSLRDVILPQIRDY
jgi:hypothetical protein